jgi:regulator of protease activity HflC (stomatin/prohibitin superfamily)
VASIGAIDRELGATAGSMTKNIAVLVSDVRVLGIPDPEVGVEYLLAGLAVAGATALATSLRILWEYERAVVFRLGRIRQARGPGLIFLVPFGVERMRRVSLRIVAMDIPPQDVITRDNVSVKVNAVLYFRVNGPVKAIVEVEDYLFATSQLAQTTLRSVIGQAELDDLLAEREKYNDMLRKIIDEHTDVWGIEVTAVEVKDIDLPQEMKRAMARQAEAERERRAKVVNALGEFQASRKLVSAAKIMSADPAALQLRFLQTVSEIAAENNSTTLFPIPMELFKPFMRADKAALQGEEEGGEEVEGVEELEGGEESLPELPPGEALPGRLAADEPVRAKKREK